MKNLVVMPAFKKNGDFQPYVYRCANSWQHWCKKYGIDFIFWDEPIYSMDEMTPTFQKTAIFKALRKYEVFGHDQISVVDYDTYIFPWAENYFLLTENEFSAVNDNGEAGPLNRSIQMVKENWYPKSPVRWANYFNSGFITFGWKHEEVFNDTLEFYKKEHEKWLKVNKSPDMTDEQTILNFIVRDKGFRVNLLPRDFNVLDFHLNNMLQSRTDHLGRRIEAINTIRQAAQMVHFTQSPEFRNNISEVLEKTYPNE